MILAYILIIAAIIVFVISFITGLAMIIKLKGKKKWYTCINCGCLIPLAIILIGVGSWVFTRSIEEDKRTNTLDYYESLYEENEDLKTELDSNTDTKSDKTTTKDSTTTTKKKTSDYDIYNEKYDYLFNTGPASGKITQKRVTDQDWAVDFYAYCHPTSDPDLSGDYLDCPSGTVEIFSISVYNKKQYDEIKNSELSDFMVLLGQDKKKGYYFVIGHPNGVLPDDIKNLQKIYDAVADSFILEKNL